MRDNRRATSRRTFLKALSGALGVAALPVPRAPHAHGANDYDVIVIGGGFTAAAGPTTSAGGVGHR